MSRSARFTRVISTAFLLGIVAHVGSWPLAAFYFHQFSVVAPLANLLISFLADALVVGGLVFSTAPILPWWLIAAGLSLLRTLALIFAAPSWAAFSVAALPTPYIFVYYALVGGLATVARTHILKPRRLFTTSAAAQTDTADTGSSGRSPLPSRPVPLLDPENRT